MRNWRSLGKCLFLLAIVACLTNTFLEYCDYVCRKVALAEEKTSVPAPLNGPFSKDDAKAARDKWAAARKVDADISNRIGMKFNLIPPGAFEMGSDKYDDTKPVHKVKISKPFYLCATEVTQAQWQAVMGTTPWKENVENRRFANHKREHAASYLSWDDAVEFCEKLSAREGKKYRLPTEAEWEYACRAGSKTEYSFANDESSLGDYAWFFSNTWDVDELYAHAVGQKEPNAFGLFDMHGNVCEWCQDYYKSDYYKNSPLADPANLETSTYRVLRGGSWVSHAKYCRSAIRSYDDQPDRNDRYGFRVVCELE